VFDAISQFHFTASAPPPPILRAAAVKFSSKADVTRRVVENSQIAQTSIAKARVQRSNGKM